MSLEKLQPANPRDVTVYAPYYQGRKRSALPLAISLYQVGNLEGARRIEGGESIPFVASWSVSSIPADLTRCRLQFDNNAELSYEVMLANFEFVDFLIELLFIYKSSRNADFSQSFYRKLLRLDD
ncbi:type IV pilus biogenesis protein EbsA [Leptolyngbya ohadii]|uniref:type IV pilus biogenesis protein EbsA n=1 Tax=Leptolyngbya ohadii TaxID=1962290 RepID=UPI000B59A2E8|nr:type IV pilus biogenesis protein EbsA [Leptolyngbya ohadii]